MHFHQIYFQKEKYHPKLKEELCNKMMNKNGTIQLYNYYNNLEGHK